MPAGDRILTSSKGHSGGSTADATVFRARSFRFFFYSNEGRPREPPHVHVEQGEREAKFWLRPMAHLAYNDGFSARTLRELLTLIEANRERIEKAWNEFFG